MPEDDQAECYLEVAPLPPECWPAWVVRADGATLVTVDPSSTRAEVAGWSPDHLTEAEMNAYRVAYRQPLVGRPLDDWWMTAGGYPLDVPEQLRLLPEPAAEILRRHTA